MQGDEVKVVALSGHLARLSAEGRALLRRLDVLFDLQIPSLPLERLPLSPEDRMILLAASKELGLPPPHPEIRTQCGFLGTPEEGKGER